MSKSYLSVIAETTFSAKLSVISDIGDLKEVLKEKMNYKDSAGHFIYNSLCNRVGKENINFMVDGNYTSNTDLGVNPLVKIIRN